MSTDTITLGGVRLDLYVDNIRKTVRRDRDVFLVIPKFEC